MIIGEIRETVTETQRIYEYTTVLPSGALANVTVARPILSAEEYAVRQKKVEQALIDYAKGVIADGFDWEEATEIGRKNYEQAQERCRLNYKGREKNGDNDF